MATPNGGRPIASLKVDDQVLAYNPTTGHTDTEPVQHVWLNHDHDLVEVGLHETASSTSTTTPSSAPTPTRLHRWLPPSLARIATGIAVTVAIAVTLVTAAPAHAAIATTAPSGTHDETIHTTANHPWLTADRGWVESGDLKPGEAVVTLSGTTETVAWVHVTAGQADMYNLTVASDHTYAVGAGHAVVHNECITTRDPQGIGFTQDSIHSAGNDYTVQGNIQRLRDDPNWDIPSERGPIRIFQKTPASDGLTMSKHGHTGYGDNLINGEWYTLDNRRLYAYQQAPRSEIPVQIVTEQEAMLEMWKWTTTTWGIDMNVLP